MKNLIQLGCISLALSLVLVSCTVEHSMTDLSANNQEGGLELPEVDQPNIFDLKVQFRSGTEVDVSWNADIEPVAEAFRISFRQGNTPPSNCQRARSADSMLNQKSHRLEDLEPNTDYAMRVCSYREKQWSMGEAFRFRTLPGCDYTVNPNDLDSGTIGTVNFTANGDGTDSFQEMENFITAAGPIGDINGDGALGICFTDGVNVVNNDALAEDVISILEPYIVLYGLEGADVTFQSLRTNGGGVSDHSVFEFFSQSGSLVNLNLQTDGSDGRAIIAGMDHKVHLLSQLRITKTGDGGAAIEATAGSLSWLQNIEINVSGNNTSAILSELTRIDGMANSFIQMTGTGGIGIRFTQSGLGPEISSSIVETMGADSPGVLIDANATMNSSLSFKNLRIRTYGVNSTGLLNRGTTLNLNNSSIYTQGDNSVALELGTDSQASLSDMRLATSGENSHGIFLSDNAAVLGLNQSRIERITTGDSAAVALLAQSGGSEENYFTTTNVKDNITCTSLFSSQTWTNLLANGEAAGPWIQQDNVITLPSTGGTVFNARTFPWGDATDVDSNPGWNAQTLWGGECP